MTIHSASEMGQQARFPLSKRQRLLLDRLKIVCSRVEEKPLPVRVEEIWAFGSFIRGKERPGDLDLAVKYSAAEPKFEVFRKVMDVAVRVRGASTPKDAVLQLLEEGVDRRESEKLGISEEAMSALEFVRSLPSDLFNEYTSVFRLWSEGYTWDMVDREMVPAFAFNWERVTKRVLLNGVPGVSIPQISEVKDKFWLAAQAYQLVWSRELPDIEANVRQVLTESSVEEASITELENFTHQISLNKFESKILEATFKALRQTPTEHFASKEGTRRDLEEWAKQRAVELFPNESKEIVQKAATGWGLTVDDTKLIISKSITPIPPNLKGLKKAVEGARVHVKTTFAEARVLRKMLRTLESWKMGILNGEEWFERWSAEDYVAWKTIDEIPKREVKEETIRAILRKFGLPENRVLAIKAGYGKTQYEIPPTDEIRNEILRGNQRREVEKRFRMLILPAVKQANKELELRVEIDEELSPLTAVISFGQWYDSYQKSDRRVDEVIDWMRKHSFKIEESDSRVYAELRVLLQGCTTAKEMKREVTKRLE